MQTTTRTAPGGSQGEVTLVALKARRLVGLERSYTCAECGSEHRSWTRLRACPECGDRLAVAVVSALAFTACRVR